VKKFFLAIDAAVNKIVRGSSIVMRVLMCLVILIYFVTVVLRNVFNTDFYGMEEIIMLVAVWMYALGGIRGSYDGVHISADLIQASVKSERGKIIHHLYKYTVCAVVTTILTYWTWNWLVWVTQTNPVSTAYRFPLIWAYSSLLVLFGFSAIFFFRHVGIGILRMVRLHRQHRSGGGQPSEAK